MLVHHTQCIYYLLLIVKLGYNQSLNHTYFYAVNY